MQNWSMRWTFFIIALTLFWMLVPLFVLTRFTGPLGGVGLLVSIVFVWYGAPKANAWLVLNSAVFRTIWYWARENEETP